MRLRRLLPSCAALAALAAAGCGGATPTGPGLPAASAHARYIASGDARVAKLVTVAPNGALEYWPIQAGGSDSPRVLSKPLGIGQPYGLVANGNVVAIANYSPAEIVTYDVKKKTLKTLADPFGGPVDIAIGKDATLYADNLASVAVFKPGSSQPTELTCSHITNGIAIAVDNESDVFVNGYGPNGFMGVVEYPSGSQNCIVPHLRKELGYAGGVGVDPKTDDLIVVDDPDLCAGGIEGRMVIYPKPYRQRTSIRRVLGAQYCSGTFRLDATSTHIFVSDATVSEGFPLIDWETYPGAQIKGTYEVGSASGDFSGFTTIPNTLPN